MKKYGKIIFLLVVIILTLLIYKLTYHKGYNYVALGDGLAVGVNSYGEENYGYSDYVKDYLNNNEFLKSYIKNFAVSSYTIDDLKEDIDNNKRISINNEEVSIRKVLRESDLVTISIGANDFIAMFGEKKLDYNAVKKVIDNKNFYVKKIDVIANKLNKLLIEIKKYAKNDIMLLGYYNPLPYLTNYKNKLDDLVEYGNFKLSEICEKNNIYYVDIFDDLNGKKYYFSNPSDIHPNSYGYQAISKNVIGVIKANIIN